MNKSSNLANLYEHHVAKAHEYEKENDMKSCHREWKDALRIRPSSVDARTAVDRLQTVLFPSQLEPLPVCAVRLSSYFNLSMRYWDRNMPKAALAEVCMNRFSFSLYCSVTKLLKSWMIWVCRQRVFYTIFKR